MLILCAYVVVSVPHGVGVDHSTTAGKTRGQVSSFLGRTLLPTQGMAPHTGMSLQCQRDSTEKTTETSLLLYFLSDICFRLVFIPWWSL